MLFLIHIGRKKKKTKLFDIGRRPKVFKQTKAIHGRHGNSKSCTSREGFFFFS